MEDTETEEFTPAKNVWYELPNQVGFFKSLEPWGESDLSTEGMRVFTSSKTQMVRTYAKGEDFHPFSDRALTAVTIPDKSWVAPIHIAEMCENLERPNILTKKQLFEDR